jgi:hypothetical protein
VSFCSFLQILTGEFVQSLTVVSIGLARAGRMAVMPAPAPRLVRPLSIVLAAGAGVAGVLVGLALWNPWRLTALYPLASAGGAIATLTLAGALLAGAALLVLAGTGRRALIGLMVGLVAVPALCVGLPAVVLDSSFRDRHVTRTQVLATSPDADYSVVAVTVDTDGGPLTQLYVRSRAWLFSREAAVPLAECPYDPFADGLPPESVRFTGETTVAVPVMDSSTVTVTFDPDTLGPRTPNRPVAMCP